MSEYIQIQTYATCTQKTLSAVLARFRSALQEIGCSDSSVLDWVDTITWADTEDDNFGDIYASDVHLAHSGLQELVCSAIEISFYSNAAVLSLEEAPTWIGFNLQFVPEQLQIQNMNIYTRQAGESLWSVLTILAQAFPEIGAYLTNTWQENQTWRAIAEKSGDPWNFELGIFPRALAPHFEEVPAGFQGTTVNSGFSFAQQNLWEQLPWASTTTTADTTPRTRR